MGESVGFSSAKVEAAALPLPRVLGRLILLKLIARGGMGDVFLAATTGIEGAERACVVKTVRRDHIHDGSFLARFLDEARVQAQLNHPGVAQVLEASTDESGEPYTVVEYVEGRSLAEVRQRSIQLAKKIEWPEAVAVIIEMAQALAHVHERSGTDGSPLQIVHRDLSPQNVMIGYAGEVKVIDFGTARGHNRRCHTVAGVVFAKPGYVAPEVARQQVGDARIDVYALGIMLWELVSGRRFFTGNDPQKLLEDAAAGRIVVPTLSDSFDTPALLDEIVTKLTANEPDDRYASASRAVADLAKLLATAPPTASGERGIRARVSGLMNRLWSGEPAKSRAEFARLLKEARNMRHETSTPQATRVVENVASRMAPEDPQVLAGTPYRLAKKIGEGASGIVYEAEHIELGRLVALKVLAPEHASATDAIERFRREARAVAKLSHPNLVQLFDFGKSLDGRVFLAMELLDGETLDKRLKRIGAMAWRDAVSLGIEVCRALEAAHDAKLVHRDLKPANLFLTEAGAAKLLDFGVAMALAETTGEKRQKGFAIFGTPEYMAPEQVAGEIVDARCDLYSLGCVLYEALAGSPVFDGSSSVVVMGKQLRETPEPFRVRTPSHATPVDVETAVFRALEKKPADRFANASEMRAALEATLEAPMKRASRTKNVALMAFTTAAIAGALVLAMKWRGEDPKAFAMSAWSATLSSTSTSTSTSTTPTTPAVPSPTIPIAPAADTQPAAEVVAAADPPPSPAETASAPSRSERDQMLSDFRAHAKDHAGDPGALRSWAWAARRAGEMREARRAANAWALHDGTAEPRIFLAEVLDNVGRHSEARNVLDEWLEQHPDSLEARKALLRITGDRARRAEIARK
jgi:serine/threonine protein kinase